MADINNIIHSFAHIIEDYNILSRFYVAAFGFSLALSAFDIASDSVFLSNLVLLSREYEATVSLINQTKNTANPIINFSHQSGNSSYCDQVFNMEEMIQNFRIGYYFYLVLYTFSIIMGITGCLYLYLILIKFRDIRSERYIAIGSLLKCMPILLQNMPEIYLMIYFANIRSNPDGFGCFKCRQLNNCHLAVEVLIQNSVDTHIRYYVIGFHSFSYGSMLTYQLWLAMIRKCKRSYDISSSIDNDKLSSSFTRCRGSRRSHDSRSRCYIWFYNNIVLKSDKLVIRLVSIGIACFGGAITLLMTYTPAFIAILFLNSSFNIHFTFIGDDLSDVGGLGLIILLAICSVFWLTFAGCLVVVIYRKTDSWHTFLSLLLWITALQPFLAFLILAFLIYELGYRKKSNAAKTQTQPQDQDIGVCNL